MKGVHPNVILDTGWHFSSKQKEREPTQRSDLLKGHMFDKTPSRYTKNIHVGFMAIKATI
jgi:hypothetical protein